MKRYVVYNKNFNSISDYLEKGLYEGLSRLPESFRDSLTRMVGSTRFGRDSIITPIQIKAWRHGWKQPFTQKTLAYKGNWDTESQQLYDYNKYLDSIGKPRVNFYAEIPDSWWNSKDHLGEDLAKYKLDEYNYYAEALGLKKVSDSRDIPKDWKSHVEVPKDIEVEREFRTRPDGSIDLKFDPYISPKDFAKYVKYN